MRTREPGILRSLTQLLFGFVTAIVGTILLSWPLLYLFLKGEHLNKLVSLSVKQVMGNYNDLMAYLLSPFVKTLRMRDLPTSVSAASHFYEVKNLFQLVLAIFLLLLAALIIAKYQRIDFRLDKKMALLFMVLPVVVVPFASMNFDAFFVFFHGIFFHNSDWLFDPVTDPIINVLSENFFASCFVTFLVLYEIYFGSFIFSTKRKSMTSEN